MAVKDKDRINLAGALLYGARIMRGLSRHDVATELELHEETIRSYEKGRRPFGPALRQRLWPFAELFDISGRRYCLAWLTGVALAEEFIEELITGSVRPRGNLKTMPWHMRHWVSNVLEHNRITPTLFGEVFWVDQLELSQSKTGRHLERELLSKDARDKISKTLRNLVDHHKLIASPNEMPIVFRLLLRLSHYSLDSIGDNEDATQAATEVYHNKNTEHPTRRELAIGLCRLGKTEIMADYLDATEDNMSDRFECVKELQRQVNDQGDGIEALSVLLTTLEGNIQGGKLLLVALALRTILDILSVEFSGTAAVVRPTAFTSLENVHRLKINLKEVPKLSNLNPEEYSLRIEPYVERIHKRLQRFVSDVANQLSDGIHARSS